jgi:hypothetical protein
MPDIKDVKARPAELLRQMKNGNLYREAYSQGKTLSWYLEEQDPSEDWGEQDRTLDAFERMIKAARIVTKSDMNRGYYASKFEAFDTSEDTRALVPEFINRTWRSVTNGHKMSTRGVIVSSDYALNTWMNQYTDAPGIRGEQLTAAIPLSEIVARTNPIDNDAYRAFYLTDADSSPDQLRMVRISEGAEIPRVKLIGGENTIRLRKFGRALEVSYETLRRQPIDMVAFHISRMAVQAEKDRVAAALDTIVNGDGNTGTAATVVTISSLGGVAGTLDFASWIAFKMQFDSPYFPTTVLATEGVALDLQLLNAGSANLPIATLPTSLGNMALRPINPRLADGLALGWTSDAPANKIVAFDNRMAIERVTEIGSDISEVERWTTRQTQTLTMTEVEGYAVIDPGATRILDIAS